MAILQHSGPPVRGLVTRLRLLLWLLVLGAVTVVIVGRWLATTPPAAPSTHLGPALPPPAVTSTSPDWLTIITASWSLFLAALPWLAIAALVAWAWGRRGLVWRDRAGQWPTLRAALDNMAAVQTAGELTARIEAAKRPNVPASIHYSPAYSYHQSNRETPLALQAPVTDQLANLPGQVGLLDALRIAPLPAGTILLGLDAGGRAVTLDPAVSPHLLAVGRSRSGKTFTSRGYLAQRLAAGAGAVVLDPHYNGPVWAPLEPYIIGQPATTPAAAGAALGWLVAEMEARLAMYRVEGDAGMARYRPLVAWIDEAPAMLADKAAAEYVTTLLRQAGKVGINVYLLSQDALTDTLKTNSGVRVNLTASLVAGLVDDSTAKAALGTGHGVPLGQLGRGVAALRLDGYPAQLVRTPAAALDDLAGLLASGPVEDGRVLALAETRPGHWSAAGSRGETRPGQRGVTAELPTVRRPFGDHSATVRPPLAPNGPEWPNAPTALARSAIRSADMGSENALVIPSNERTNDQADPISPEHQELIRRAIMHQRAKQVSLEQLFGVRPGNNPGWRRYSAAWDTIRAQLVAGRQK